MVSEFVNDFLIGWNVALHALLGLNAIVFRGVLQTRVHTVQRHIVDFSLMNWLRLQFSLGLFLGNYLGGQGWRLCRFLTIISHFCSSQNVLVLFALYKFVRLLRHAATFGYWLRFRLCLLLFLLPYVFNLDFVFSKLELLYAYVNDPRLQEISASSFLPF